MRGSSSNHRCCNARPVERWQGSAVPAAQALLAQFSRRLPPQLLERLRVAAPQLGLRRGDIAPAAIDRFLTEHGF